ncbi:MAG: Ig domain-containing protein [Lachnospiraceae bacterium]|nr:Ig domain-containing protein [Lachnospiraceae bacterium]
MKKKILAGALVLILSVVEVCPVWARNDIQNTAPMIEGLDIDGKKEGLTINDIEGATDNDRDIEVEEELSNGRTVSRLSGSGTESDPYLISTIEDIQNAQFSEDAYYVITNNIDMTNVAWKPVYVTGHINGEGHAIIGLKNSRLFTYSTSGSGLYIKNLNIDTAYYDTVQYGVGFADRATELENCVISGTIKADSSGSINCLVDTAYKVINCKNQMNISAPNAAVCGIVSQVTIAENCENIGNISAETVYGIAGEIIANGTEKKLVSEIEQVDKTIQLYESEAWMKKCVNQGNLSGNKVAAIIGTINNGYSLPYNTNTYVSIQNCENYGEIVGKESASGLAEYVTVARYEWGSAEPIVSILDCRNYGTVISDSKSAGFLCEGLVSNEYQLSTYQEQDRKIEHSLQIGNCINFGEMIGGATTGGIISELHNKNADVIIFGCKNEGSMQVDVKGTDSVYSAGILSEFDSYSDSRLAIINCRNFGSVVVNDNNETGTTTASAGILAYYDGILSNNDKLEISMCYNTGDISAEYVSSGITGNIFGGSGEHRELNITNCYNAGTIICEKLSACAIAKSVDDSFNRVEVENCYNVGELSGKYGALMLGMDEDNLEKNYYEIKNLYNLSDYSANYQYGVPVTYLTNSQMQQQSSFAGFDFDNVWEMGTGNYPYPVLRDAGIKEEPPMCTSASVALGEAVFQVIDEKGKVIPTARVQYGSETPVEIMNGIVRITNIPETEEDITFTVSATDYESKEITLTKEQRKTACKVILIKYGLKSAEMTYNGNRFDLLVQEKKIDVVNKNTKFTLKCTVTDSVKNNIAKYLLEQMKDKKTYNKIAESKDGSFALKNSDFKEGQEVYISGYDDSNHKLFRRKINLNVIKSKAVTKTTINLGKDLAFTIGDDVPLIGGKKISLNGITALPVYTEVSDETYKVGFNINLGKLDEGEDENGNSKKREWESGLKKTFSGIKDGGSLYKDVNKALERKYKDIMKYVEKEYKPSKNPNVSIGIAGYAEGPVTGEKLKGTLYLIINIGASREIQVKRLPPIVVAYNIDGTIKAGGETEYVFSTSEFQGDIFAEGSIAIKAYGGAGVENLISGGIYGKGEIGAKIILLPVKVFGLEYAKISGSMGLAYRLLGKERGSIELLKCKDHYFYKRDTGTSKETLASAGQSDMEAVRVENLLDADAFVTIPHEQTIFTEIEETEELPNSEKGLTDDISVSANDVTQDMQDAQNAGQQDDREAVYEKLPSANLDYQVDETWKGEIATQKGEISAKYVQENSYIDPSPKLAICGDDIILLYLDDSPARNAQNASTLVFSLYQKETNTWSKPQIIDDNGTADYNITTFSSGDTLAVLWNDGKSIVPDGVDLNLTETAEATDLAMMVYDVSSHTFADKRIITDNGIVNDDGTVTDGIYENMTSVAEHNGEFTYLWFENEQRDVFGIEGKNRIYLKQGGEKRQLAESDRPILDELLFGISDQLYAAYVSDQDGDLNDVSDSVLTVLPVGQENGTWSTIFEGSVESLQFTSWQNQQGLFWCSGGNAYFWNGTDVTVICEGISGTDIQLLTDSDEIAHLVFTTYGDECSNLCERTYDVLTGKWNEQIFLTDCADYLEQADSMMTGTTILSVYNMVSAVSDEESGITVTGSRLGSLLSGEYVDFSIENATYLDADFQSGKELPVSIVVRNDGTVGAEGVQILLLDENSSLLAECSTNQYIASGESKELEAAIPIPEAAVPGVYKLKVKTIDSTYSDMSSEDNMMEVSLGNADVQLQTHLNQINGFHSIFVSLCNEGQKSTSGKVVVRDYDTGEELYSNIVETLMHENSYSVEIAFSDLGMHEEEERGLIIEFVSDDPEEASYNNTEYLSVIPYADSDKQETGETTPEIPSKEENSGSVSPASQGASGNKNASSNPSAGNSNTIKVRSIKLKGISKKIAAGKSIQLSAAVSPSDATNKALKWSSSNTKYAVVSASGKVSVKAKGAGKTVTITATAQDGSNVRATYKIQIMKNAVTKVQLKKDGKTLKNGKTITGKAGSSVKLKSAVKVTNKKGKVKSAYKANKTLKWTSSNTKYATVNKSGKVKLLKAGKGKTVTITAEATDGSGKKTKVKIKIK